MNDHSREMHQFSMIVGPRHADCSFENFATASPKQKAAKDLVCEYVRQLPERVKAGENLIIFGPPGTGKDHLMCAAAADAINRGIRGVGPRSFISPERKEVYCVEGLVRSRKVPTLTWSSGAMLADQFRDAMKGKASTSALLHATVLAISDPALDGQMSDFQARELFRIIDHRYRHRLPVWITCNMDSPEEFDQRLTRQVADRLREGATTVFCNWDSYRRAKPLSMKPTTAQNES